MKISVIVPVYNALDDVKELLKSIKKNFNFKLGEIFFINDCSNEETRLYLKENVNINSNAKLIHNKSNLGFIGTCNKGIRLAHNEIIVLLNSDTKIPEEFCERIIKCFESDAKIGVASPIASASGTFYIPLPQGYSLKKMNERLRKYHKCSYPVIPAAEGFCFCIRKSLINIQGALDPIFGKGYYEEVDFSYRAITNGFKNVLIDDLYVQHKRQASFSSEGRIINMRKNRNIFYDRWGTFREDYEKQINFKNPVLTIEKEMKIPVLDCDRTPLEYLFSIKNAKNKKHKIITLMGLKLKVKSQKLETKLWENAVTERLDRHRDSFVSLHNKSIIQAKKIEQQGKQIEHLTTVINQLTTRLEDLEKIFILNSPLWDVKYYMSESGHDFGTKQEAFKYWYNEGFKNKEAPSKYIDMSFAATQAGLKNPLIAYSAPYNVKRSGRNNYYKILYNQQKVNEYLDYKKTRLAKGVLYTCITNDYDDIKEIKAYTYFDKDWDYVLFTDNEELINKGQEGIWKIRPLYNRGFDNTRNQRWHKINPHILFPEYNKSIWIDANINILTDKLFHLANNTSDNFFVCEHFERICLYKEFEAVRNLAYDSEEILSKQYELYKKEGMPENYGFAETNVLFRKHNDEEIKKVDSEWWYMIENYSKRDQLSFTYILWKNNIKLDGKMIENVKSDYKNFLLFLHKKSHIIYK